MDQQLFRAISIIEQKNNENFNDPFYTYSLVLDQIYIDYLSTSKLCTDKNFNLDLLFHLEDLLETMEKVRSIYIKRIAEYRKWRIQGFKKRLYLVLSQEADEIANNIADCMCLINDTEENVISYDTFCDLESIFKSTMLQSTKASESLSRYHLENLW